MENNKNQLLKNINEANQAVRLIQDSINNVNGNMSRLSTAVFTTDYYSIFYR